MTKKQESVLRKYIREFGKNMHVVCESIDNNAEGTIAELIVIGKEQLKLPALDRDDVRITVLINHDNILTVIGG